jgi:2-oxoglutarate/2-oxoacid ferredoxin oxidoreductase subunit beta
MIASCSLLHAATDDRVFGLEDYEGALPRWCPGCGDMAVLTAYQKLLAEEQLKPEETMFVSGIGCSSRFPHYMRTYGFHGIHGRALPVATGIKLHRPDLNVFVVMGDGDCTSIGAGHWLHAVRYNMDMTAVILDNNIYGLTKMQTSPTTPQGYKSNTQPRGSYLPALNPIENMLGFTNASFVAQTAEWIPQHLYATLRAAHRHKGLGFVRILQRCPKFTAPIFQEAVRNPDAVELLVHDDGITVPEIHGLYKNHRHHDPKDIDMARVIAEEEGRVPLGIFFQDETRAVYEETRRLPKYSAEEKIDRLNQELENYAV